MNDFQQVISFWFDEIDHALWFKKDSEFDRIIMSKFATLHAQAMAGELYEWRVSPLGRLAEIIVLDQFSRNMYRESPKAFLSDPLALVLAQEAVAQGQDKLLTQTERSFLYMPYMHSESMMVHQQALTLFNQAGLESNYAFEKKHLEIIERFGRYPHRNSILGRESTAEEIAFLMQPGSSF
ncbi:MULTISPECIES: DUF924 family protein [Shewanella]|uniref:DUF924 family protein n=1 Tax=Shewanella TaxID=22 RepID=UPI001BBFBAB5|nr:MULTISPECIES: DUF924 family protein [Shewanella]GIU53158.1 membrane protein [Shewanella sp. KT0246]